MRTLFFFSVLSRIRHISASSEFDYDTETLTSSGGPVCTAAQYSKYLPHFFSCRGSPSWTKFITDVHESAKTGFSELPENTYQDAMDIVQRWDAKPYPPQHFHNLLCDASKVMFCFSKCLM